MRRKVIFIYRAVSYFPHCLDRIPSKNYVAKVEFGLAHGYRVIQFTLGECEVAGHIVSSLRKQRDDCSPCFSFLFGMGPQHMRCCHLCRGLLPSFKPPWTHSLPTSPEVSVPGGFKSCQFDHWDCHICYVTNYGLECGSLLSLFLFFTYFSYFFFLLFNDKELLLKLAYCILFFQVDLQIYHFAILQN